MRYLLLLCFLFPAVFADDKGIPASADEKYQGYEPDKKLYQKKWGIFFKRVSIKKIDWERRHEARLSVWGMKFLVIGAIILVLGIAGNSTFQNKLIDTVSSFATATGALFIGVGMLFMKLTEVWHYAGYVLGIGLVIFLIWYLRDKGIIKCKHKTKTKKDEE